MTSFSRVSMMRARAWRDRSCCFNKNGHQTDMSRFKGDWTPCSINICQHFQVQLFSSTPPKCGSWLLRRCKASCVSTTSRSKVRSNHWSKSKWNVKNLPPMLFGSSFREDQWEVQKVPPSRYRSPLATNHSLCQTWVVIREGIVQQRWRPTAGTDEFVTN